MTLLAKLSPDWEGQEIRGGCSCPDVRLAAPRHRKSARRGAIIGAPVAMMVHRHGELTQLPVFFLTRSFPIADSQRNHLTLFAVLSKAHSPWLSR